MRRALAALAASFAVIVGVLLILPGVASAQVQPPDAPSPGIPAPGIDPSSPEAAEDAGTTTGQGADATLAIRGEEPAQPVVIILGLTVLSLAPSLLIMCTTFTRFVIVLSLTRNAIGLPTIPPNQVLVGLSLFLSLFVMAPTLSEMNEVALQPLLKGEITSYQEAFELAQDPLKDFMLANTRKSELAMMIDVSRSERPETEEDVSLAVLIPAFILSELKTAFIIGFIVFVPFLVIDFVVSSVLMALGMMMLPPVFVSLPFKLLLFVMVDGWNLVVLSLVENVRSP